MKLSLRTKPFVTNLATIATPRPTTRAIALAEPTPRRGASLAAVSLPGIVHSGGWLYDPYERDRAWSWGQKDETIRAMSLDTVLGYCLIMVTAALRRVEWYLNPADDSQEAEDIADFYQECLDAMEGQWPGEPMAQIVTFLTWGWSVVEPVYVQREDGRIGWERWQLIPQMSRLRWEFDKNDRVTGLIQQNLSNPSKPREIPIPLSRCIVFRYTANDNNPEGFSPLRVAYDAWAFRRSFQQLEGILFERFGGLPIGRMPSSDIVAENEAYQEMQRIITSLKMNEQSGLVLASDRDEQGNYEQDFELKAPMAGATVPSADPIIARYDRQMVSVYLAQIAQTGQTGTGSYALADVQSTMFQQGLATHLDTTGDNITTQEFPRFAALNPWINPKLIPTLKHGNIESEDLARIGAYIKVLADADELYRSPELTEHLHKLGDLPVPSLDELRAAQEAEKAAAEKAQKDALQSLRTAQQTGPNGASPQGAEKSVADLPEGKNGNVAASEVRQLIEADGQLSLSDLMDVVQWWNSQFPEYAGMLDATIIGDNPSA